MGKRKEPVDAFGLSLLDVLSNAVGGVILLVLIVAVTLRGNDYKRLNLPDEQRSGEAYTVLKFDKSKNEKKKNMNLLVVQIKFHGGSMKCEISGDASECSLGIEDTSEQLTNRGFKEMIIFRKKTDQEQRKWEITTVENDTRSIPDSVSVFVTANDKVICASTRAYTKQNSVPILSVSDSDELKNISVKFLGSDCTY